MEEIMTNEAVEMEETQVTEAEPMTTDLVESNHEVVDAEVVENEPVLKLDGKSLLVGAGVVAGVTTLGYGFKKFVGYCKSDHVHEAGQHFKEGFKSLMPKKKQKTEVTESETATESNPEVKETKKTK